MIGARRALMLLSNLVCAVGPYWFDWNETHVRNPRWPPHARFHNGQTMSLGLLLGATSIYFLLRTTSDHFGEQDSVTTAAIVGSLYWISGLSARLYPGTDWCDPEFKDRHGAPQKLLFSAYFLINLLGYGLEMRSLMHQQ